MQYCKNRLPFLIIVFTAMMIFFLFCATKGELNTELDSGIVVLCIFVNVMLFKLEIVSDRIKKAAFLLTPAVGFIILETAAGSLFLTKFSSLIVNLLIYYALYAAVFAMTNRARLTGILLNMLFLIVGILENYINTFRGSPIMPWDLLSIGVAADVAGNYNYTPSACIIAAILIYIVWITAVFKLDFKIEALKKRLLFLIAIPSSAAIMVGLYFLFAFGLKYEVDFWRSTESYAQNGFAFSTMLSVKYINTDEPDSYSIEAVKQIQDEYNDEESVSTGTTPVNIICIMNESLSDLSVINDFSTNTEYLPFISSLSENTIKGNMYSPVYGARTCNPEFEFLTGNSMAFLPTGSSPFENYIKNDTYAMPTWLKSIGYSAIAMHPQPASNWNREKVYEYMGFDEFYDIESFDEDTELVRSYISDKATYDKIIEIYEQKEENDPLFVFDVTMQNHGGYLQNMLHFPMDVTLTDYTDFPKTNTYLSLIKISDDAFEYLLDYFSQIDDPTMIVMFGDHQPKIEEEFYQALYGKSISNLSEEESMLQYVTPFIIWTNYDMESQYIDKLSASFLPSLVLKTANIELPVYQEFLYDLSQELPVVHPLGYYDNNDVFYTWDDWEDEKYYELINKYKILQYNNMFDVVNRVNEIFAMP